MVLVRTWVDDLPEEAKAITTLFLADAAAAALALPDGTEWAALIDEFGGVLSSGAGERALALMQRARSAGGQVAVSTQSVIDFAAATGNPALLDAMADNFGAGIFHRQSSPESRDWLARLIGTREVWQLDRPHRRRRQLQRGIRQPPPRARVPRPPRRVPHARHRRSRDLDHARTRPRAPHRHARNAARAAA